MSNDERYLKRTSTFKKIQFYFALLKIIYTQGLDQIFQFAFPLRIMIYFVVQIYFLLWSAINSHGLLFSTHSSNIMCFALTLINVSVFQKKK